MHIPGTRPILPDHVGRAVVLYGAVVVKVAFYARVSRDDLNCENQVRILKDWAQRNDITNYTILTEEMSTRKTRPIKQQLIQEFRDGKVDTIVVTKIDRFARSLQELVADVRYIVDNGGRFVAISNGMDFTKKHFNASQQLMLNIFASFAEFEREIIRERTLEGLARARAQGKRLGRPPKTPPAKTPNNGGENGG